MKKWFAAGIGVVEPGWLVSEQIAATKTVITPTNMIPAISKDANVQWKLRIRGGCGNIRRSRELRKQ
jgi:hypothetical protein